MGMYEEKMQNGCQRQRKANMDDMINIGIRVDKISHFDCFGFVTFFSNL